MLDKTAFIPVPGGGQTISTSGISAKATNPAPQGCACVSIHATADAYIHFGATGDSADSTGYFVAADTKEYLAIPDGAYVHAIQVSGAGTVYVHWMKGR